MTSTVQANFKVPESSHRLVAAVAKRLREDVTFRHRLMKFMEEDADSGAVALLAQRLDQVERQLADLQRVQGLSPTGADETGNQASTPSEPKLHQAETANPPTWTVGAGRGRRLTMSGEEELYRLVDEGMSITDVARRLGVSPHAVHSRLVNR